jgi:IS30 family transposase
MINPPTPIGVGPRTSRTIHKPAAAVLRTKRKFRHSRSHRAGTRSQIVDGISIRERPAAVEDRAVPGHWEGDLICGSKNSYIATIVERQTRFTILVKVESKNTEHVVGALSTQMSKLPELLQQSLTWDRGQEMARHHDFTQRQIWTCTFAIPQVLGSVALTKIGMVCSDSTFPTRLACQVLPSRS